MLARDLYLINCAVLQPRRDALKPAGARFGNSTWRHPQHLLQFELDQP
jgi:hypothetical protein